MGKNDQWTKLELSLIQPDKTNINVEVITEVYIECDYGHEISKYSNEIVFSVMHKKYVHNKRCC